MRSLNRTTRPIKLACATIVSGLTRSTRWPVAVFGLDHVPLRVSPRHNEMVLIGETECPLEMTRKIATIVEPLLANVRQQGHDVMVEHRSIPMPEDVREAFCDAVHLFVEWKSGGPKQSVSFRRLRRVSLTGVCDLVLRYRNEPLPLKVHDHLWNLIDDTHMNLKVELATDPSYATGARCLTKLIQEYRAEDGRRKSATA
jgi:hypothetical protein